MAKTVRAASLVRYAKIPGLGWRRGSVVKAKNGRVRDVMIVAGVEHAIPADSQFQIRSYENGQAVYTGVGTDYEAAVQLLERTSASRSLAAAEEILGIKKPELEAEQPTLAELVEGYIARKESKSLALTRGTLNIYRSALRVWLKMTTDAGKRYANQVTEADILRYTDWLAEDEQGYGPKSRQMRYVALRGFLRSVGVQVEKIIDRSTHLKLAKKQKTKTNPYTHEQIDRLMVVSNVHYKMVWTLLLSAGLREREATHLTWSNIDFANNVIKVPASQTVIRNVRNRINHKPETKTVQFQTKNRDGRDVPLFPSLKAELLKWREQHPGAVFVLGTARDLPCNHWLPVLKRLARKAGLNCGVCEGCNSPNRECANWYLHKFRHTFAHRCLDAGIPVNTLSKWLGHSDLATTAIYTSGRSDATFADPFAKAVAA